LGKDYRDKKTITEMVEDNSDRPRDPLTEKIIAACYQVHNELGPGFVERIYLAALKSAFKEVRAKVRGGEGVRGFVSERENRQVQG
jgi:hypothetical protein